ncbi:MAG: hypothetical protein K6A76_08355 [Oribacterium sp.]|nr:hypothetical protein [Oribacterium sp.]
MSIKIKKEIYISVKVYDVNEEKETDIVSKQKIKHSEAFPYEFSYETKVEEIEGTATYVEWQVLKQLDEKKAYEFTEKMKKVMLKPEYFFPIRISSYNTGALMIHAMSCADNYSFATSEIPVIVSVLKKITPKMFGPDNKIIDTDVENALSALFVYIDPCRGLAPFWSLGTESVAHFSQ